MGKNPRDNLPAYREATAAPSTPRRSAAPAGEAPVQPAHPPAPTPRPAQTQPASKHDEPAQPAPGAGSLTRHRSAEAARRQRIYRCVLDVAGAQHGTISRAQLLACGMTRRAIDERVARGDLRRIFRNAYSVGPIQGRLVREWAAALIGGPQSIISYRSAARLRDIAIGATHDESVEITVPAHVRIRMPGVVAHRRRQLPEYEVCDGLRVTTVEATLLDLASVLGPADLERALASAQRAGIVNMTLLLGMVERADGRSGRIPLKKLLAAETPADLTRSEAEQQLLEMVRRAKLPRPLTNARLHGYEVDFYWPAHGLVVEVDGYAFHNSMTAFHRDRSRDAALTANGLRVIRITWRDLERTPEATLATIAQALARTAGSRR